ncbi:MAG: hypothetical protein FWE62_01710, partial [Firmicutes bacterium]|nr:hypothetical protein [Bacillota bacterium]
MHSIKHKMHHVKRMSFFFAPLLALAVFCAQFTPLTARAAPVYTISNYGDLVTYAALINAGNLAYNAPGAAYALTADIDAGNGFVPLGTALKPFNGVFDGAGFAIRDLTVSGADKTGLFGVIGAQGVVRNVKLSSVFVSAAESAGGIAGVNYGAIEGCYNLNGCVEAGISAGGIVGDNYGAVESSFSFAYAHADYNAGGVAGWNNGTIYQCFSAGHITGGANIGGVAGFNAGSVESCYNSGDVDGRQGAGGVAGVSTGTITDVYNMGAVEGAEYSAAVAGYSYGSVGFAYYNTDRSGLAEAVSNLPDTGAGAKRMGLNTAAMTGVTALNNMDFGQPTRWETRAPDIYTYHPQLKVFAQSADTQIQSLSAASVADAEKFSIVYHLNGGAFNVYYPTAFTSADSVITLPVGVERTGYT